MKFDRLPLAGAWVLDPEPKTDARGFFARSFSKREFQTLGLIADFVEHSISFNTVRGTLRGLHYQLSPHDETKVVRCTRGAIYDVIVDRRSESNTRNQWLGIELSANNRRAIYIPAGFAHGYITLEDASEVYYMIDKAHVPGQGRSLRWNDAGLAIRWPIEPTIMSDNDRHAPLLSSLDTQEESR